MPTIWTRILGTQSDTVDAYRVSWKTREPRPRLWDDGLPTTAAMLKALPKVTR